MLDLIIIGSGPAGLSAAIYGKRANLNLLVIEKDYEGTGQVALSSCVDNYLGLPGLDGYSMGEQFRQHAVDFGVEFLEATVTGIEPVCKKENISLSSNASNPASQNSTPAPDFFLVTSSDGQTLETKTIIYAAGATHRKLDVPGEARFDTKGVSYCATCDGAFYRNKTTAVIGGGDTALDDALYLSGICEKVYLVHRRDTFRAAEITVKKVMEKDNIELVLNSTLSEITGEEKVSGIKINQKNANGLVEKYLAVNGVFIAAGSKPETGILENVSGLSLNDAGYIIADESCITSLPGFFVAGDVRTKTLRQVITAVSDGAIAATAASHYIG